MYPDRQIFIDEKKVSFLNPNREYFLEGGYRLVHFKIWRMIYSNREVLNETHNRFWDIVNLYPRKTYEFSDEAMFVSEPWKEKEIVHDSQEMNRYIKLMKRYQ